MFLITFSEGNSRAKVEKNTSNDTFVCDDDAHIVVLSTCSPFFCTRWLLLEVKENNFKDAPHNKKRKTISIRNRLTKKCEKHEMNGQALQKIANTIF